MATAKYSASASSKIANGYSTTATYTGEIVSSGIEAIVYTVTYIGEPVPEPTTAPESPTKPEGVPVTTYLIYAGFILAVLSAVAVVYLLPRRNTKVYSPTDHGDEYATQYEEDAE